MGGHDKHRPGPLRLQTDQSPLMVLMIGTPTAGRQTERGEWAATLTPNGLAHPTLLPPDHSFQLQSRESPP
jgi:hypothetical protein